MLMIISLLSLASIVQGFSSIDINPVEDHIEPGENATYNVSITNERSDSQTYEVFSHLSGINWKVSVPEKGEDLTLGPGETDNVIISVQPLNNFNAGVYGVNINIRSDKGERYQQPVKVFVGPPPKKEYSPSVRASLDMNKNVDPRESQVIRVNLENLNNLNLSNTTAMITSDIPELNMDQEVDLGPRKKKTLEFSYKLNYTTQPKDYILLFKLRNNNRVIKLISDRLTVEAIEPSFERSVEKEESLLKYSDYLSLKNKGNVENTQEVTYNIGFLRGLFTSVENEGKVIEDDDGERALSWDITLEPSESKTIQLTTNYRPIAIGLIILLVIIGLYLRYRTPVDINKSASDVKIEEGGVSGLKVSLEIKNNSNKSLKNVEIIDEIPSITNIKEDVEMGTLKPTNVFRGEDGKVYAKWELSELEGKEERIITYKVKSKLNILGTLELPRAKINFENSRDRERTSYSNKYKVNTE